MSDYDYKLICNEENTENIGFSTYAHIDSLKRVWILTYCTLTGSVVNRICFKNYEMFTKLTKFFEERTEVPY